MRFKIAKFSLPKAKNTI